MPDNIRKVVVKVTTKDGKDDGAVPTYVEVDRGAGYIRVSGRDLVANKDEASFELRPGERLVVEGFTEEAVAFDREQAAAFNPATQRNAEGKTDASTGKMEQTSKTGALPTETQDSRTKSSPGSSVTPAMAASNQREQENQRLADLASKRSTEQQAAGGSKAAQASSTSQAQRPAGPSTKK